MTHKWRDIEHKNPNQDLIAEVRSKSLYGLDPVCAKIADALEAAEAAMESYEIEQTMLKAENRRLNRAIVAHHNMATLSDEVLREYDFRACPVCARAARSGSGDG